MIDAKYPGDCTECPERIRVGEAIERSDDMVGWRHVTCPDSVDEKFTRFTGTSLSEMGY